MQTKNLRNPIFFTQRILPLLLLKTLNCVKSVGIQSYSGPHFSRIITEYGDIRSISPYSVRMRENLGIRADQNNSE